MWQTRVGINSSVWGITDQRKLVRRVVYSRHIARHVLVAVPEALLPYEQNATIGVGKGAQRFSHVPGDLLRTYALWGMF